MIYELVAMPRFFFDFRDGDRTTEDCDGHECESAIAARHEALKVLPEVLLCDFQDADEREVICSVRDESGSVLYQASVTLRAQRVSNLQLRSPR